MKFDEGIPNWFVRIKAKSGEVKVEEGIDL